MTHATDPPATPAPTVREAISAYVAQFPPVTPADRVRLVQVALAALLEPDLDEPVTGLTAHRLTLLGGTLREKPSRKTGRPLAYGTFRRYVLIAQGFLEWCAAPWPRAARPKASQAAPATDEAGE